MKLWQIEITVIISAVLLTVIIYDWVCHIMGAFRELAARIETLNEKTDSIQEKLESIKSKQDEMTL